MPGFCERPYFRRTSTAGGRVRSARMERWVSRRSAQNRCLSSHPRQGRLQPRPRPRPGELNLWHALRRRPKLLRQAAAHPRQRDPRNGSHTRRGGPQRRLRRVARAVDPRAVREARRPPSLAPSPPVAGPTTWESPRTPRRGAPRGCFATHPLPPGMGSREDAPREPSAGGPQSPPTGPGTAGSQGPRRAQESAGARAACARYCAPSISSAGPVVPVVVPRPGTPLRAGSALHGGVS